MNLLRAAGLAAKVELGDEAQAALAAQADAFLRAGGALSLADWAGLDHAERAALVAAGDRLAAARAGLAGVAAHPRAAAELLAAVDGGAARAVVAEADAVALLTVAVERAAARLARGGA